MFDTTKLRQGNKKAFHKFYRTYRPKLFGYVKTKVGNIHDVEEIVQDSFLGFLDALPLFQGKSSLWTFLVSITRHEIADYYRKKYAKRALTLVPFIDLGYTQDLYSAKETRANFNAALKQVLPEERKLILWKYEQKLPIKEIAHRLDITPKAAESRLFRARKAFQVAYIEVAELV